MPSTSVHKVILPGELPPACVRGEMAGAAMEIRFSRFVEGSPDSICQPDALVSEASDERFSLDPKRAAIAVAWALDLDSQAKRRFMRGDEVSRRIRDSAEPLPTLQEAPA